MAKIITKEDLLAASEKAAAKATAAEQRRCIKALKDAAAETVVGASKDVKVGIKAVVQAATASIKG